MRASLRPVAAGFVVFGFYAGAFAVAAIDIERTFDLSDAQLGFLLAAGIIAATGLAAVGGIITDRWGAGVTMARSVIVWGSLLMVEGARPARRAVRARVHPRDRGRRPVRRRAQRDVGRRARVGARQARALPLAVEFRLCPRRDRDRRRAAPRCVVARRVGGHRRGRDHQRLRHVPLRGARAEAGRAPVDVARARRTPPRRTRPCSRSCSRRRRWSKAGSRRSACSTCARTSGSACSRASARTSSATCSRCRRASAARRSSARSAPGARSCSAR